jgi:hypothetical protein
VEGGVSRDTHQCYERDGSRAQLVPGDSNPHGLAPIGV